jgi:soluble P-type ATPase
MLTLTIPGRDEMVLEHLLLDMNGTLADRGELIDGVAPLVRELSGSLVVHLVSADTFGTAAEVARELSLTFVEAASGEDKRDYARELGPNRCVVVGNGANDVLVMELAALSLAIVGPEGASTHTLAAADVVCRDIRDALRLLLDPRALRATLRA